MIPLRDTIRARRFPIVNTALIVLNVLVFLFQAILGARQTEQLIWAAGLIPVRFWHVGGLSGWLPLFSSMFLHGGWWHLISNMLALYIFGDNVEDRLGHVRYLLFYLVGGLAASGAHLVAYAGSPLPTIGASGAIAGVLGAYLVLYPQARVLTLIPVFYIIRVVEIPAFVYLGFWFISQLFNGFFALTAAADVIQAGGVAWWAHIGGFVFGLAIVRLISPRPRIPSPYAADSHRWYDD
ncbi:MAG: rhomboid family intramembrane serine protease [Chloroflexi bacterium]|nr:rhomboid family intramembrane serine protease [Chloroflexota bacterium]